MVVADPEPELGHLPGRVLTDERERRSLGHDVAAVHDDQAVAQLLGLVHVVGGEHQGDALLLEPEELLPHHVPRLRVETRRRLVEQQHVGAVDQRPRDRQAALHAARQLVDLDGRLLGELDEGEQLVGPTAALRPGQPEVAAVDDEVLAHRQLEVEAVLLRADAQASADRGPVGDRVEAEDAQGAPARRRHRGDHAHRRGLAGAVGAEEAERLTGRDPDVDALDGLEAPEGLAQPHRLHHRGALCGVTDLDVRARRGGFSHPAKISADPSPATNGFRPPLPRPWVCRWRRAGLTSARPRHRTGSERDRAVGRGLGRLRAGHPGVVRHLVRRAHAGPGRRLGCDLRGAQRAGGGADGVRQDAERLPVVDRPAGGGAGARAQDPVPGPLRLAAQGAGGRRRAQPAGAADRHPSRSRASRAARARHHRRRPLRGHLRGRPPLHRQHSPRHPHHHPRVALPDAHLAGP